MTEVASAPVGVVPADPAESGLTSQLAGVRGFNRTA